MRAVYAIMILPLGWTEMPGPLSGAAKLVMIAWPPLPNVASGDPFESYRRKFSSPGRKAPG